MYTDMFGNELWSDGSSVSPDWGEYFEHILSQGYDTSPETPEKEAINKAIVESKNAEKMFTAMAVAEDPMLGKRVDMPVQENVVQLVTGLDKVQIASALLWEDEISRFEADFMKMWNPGSGLQGTNMALGAVGPALLAVLSFVIFWILDYLADAGIAWLSDKLSAGGDARDVRNAIYRGGMLIGYTGTAGEVYSRTSPYLQGYPVDKDSNPGGEDSEHGYAGAGSKQQDMWW